MPLNVEDNNQANTGAAAAAAPQAQQPTAGAQAGAFNQPRAAAGTQAKAHMNATSPFSLRTNRGISRSTTSEAMRRIMEQLNKIAESEKQDNLVEYTFIPLDADKDGLNISALVVAAVPNRAQTGVEKVVTFHTLLMASTAKGVSFRESKVGNTGVSYERLVLPTDGYDNIMLETVVRSLKEAFPEHRPLSAEWTVIPTTQDLTSEDSVRNLAANATTAVWTMLASEVGGMGWNIQRDLSNIRLVAEIKKSHQHFTDLTGLPVRSDGVIELNEVTGRRNNNNDDQYNNGQRASNLMQLNFFIDLAYNPAHAAPIFGDTGGVADQQQLKTYTPRMVVTNVDSPESCDLTLQLLGLATTQLVAEGDRVVHCLINQHRDGEAHPEGGVNLRDIGAIGLEVPRLMQGYGQNAAPTRERFPTAGAGFSDASLAALIKTYVSDNLVVSIDVPEGGPSTWMTSTFAAAARGDQQAIKDIFAAADVLTGGLFTPMYQQRCGGVMQAPLYDDNLIINLGTYLSTTGLRDIRDISYLEVLNATGDRDLNTINDWANLQANAEVDEHFRAFESRKILQGLYKSMQITGRARRVTLNNQFRYTLATAIKAAGLMFEVKASDRAPLGTARLTSNYLNQQAANLGSTGAFVVGGYNKSAATSAAPGTFGRFAFQNQQQGQGQGAGY